mmetsp:Transcript_68326/g.108422  ORF Transcript_68326/g.108422 Transcript_68326/m.108422 type:complete len:626 (-) Transcript_68326:188-2065(-)
MLPARGHAILADLSSHLTIRNTFLETVTEPDKSSDALSERPATEPVQRRLMRLQSFSVTDSNSECDEPAYVNTLPATDVHLAARAARDIDMKSAEQASLAAIRNMPCSITLADPGLDDCPLIGCSDGFEVITGYRRNEIVGQNCRFLNQGTGIDPVLRAQLREAVQFGHEFIGIVPNARKNGERFRNLLHMSSLHVRGKRYIIAIQADVTEMDVNLNTPGHVDTLRATAERIFEGNIDAWVQMQAREFSMRLPAPYSQLSQLLKLCAPNAFQQERDNFVRLGTESRQLGVTGVDTTVGERETAQQAQIQNLVELTKQVELHGAQPPGLKSLGSAGHPDNCTECHFHMFNPGGCRSGKFCSFCHELHPRTNPKKNRRFMKRLASSGLVDPASEAMASTSPPEALNEAFVSAAQSRIPASSSLPAPLPMTAPPSTGASLGRPPGSFKAPAESPPTRSSDHSDPSSRSGSQKTNKTAMSGQPFGVDFIRLRYCNECSHDPSAPQVLTLVAGVRVHFPAFVEITSEKQGALEENIEFVASPPLPENLELHRSTGLISGMPAQPQEAVSMHLISISIDATGPGGIPLGTLPLTSCTIALRIVDLQRYVLSAADGIGEDGDQSVVLRLQKC